MGRERGRHDQQNTGSHAAPSWGRRGLIIVDNPEAPLRAAEAALLLALFTLQMNNHTSYWTVNYLPNDQINIRGCKLFSRRRVYI